jgi:SAM-dependent methyltransferase
VFDPSHRKPPAAGAVDDYRSIFEERGSAYHRAMVECPAARHREFEAIVQVAALRPGQVVCDAPSGGGYLHDHVPATCEVIAVETSATFHTLCLQRGGSRAILSPLERIGLPDDTVDVVISLAGLHHLPDRHAFYAEARRILKPGGVFCVADVASGSPQDRFLNGFVDRHSSLGHRGTFLGGEAAGEVTAAGFDIVIDERRDYPWTFAHVDAMLRFVSLLFGIDRADPATVRAGIARELGYVDDADGCRMAWGLRFLRASRND